MTRETIENMFCWDSNFIHWGRNSLEVIDFYERENHLHFGLSKPLDGELIKEKSSFASEYLCTLSDSMSIGLADSPIPSSPYLQKANSLLENYFEYKSLVDFLLPKLPLELRMWAFDRDRSEEFTVTLLNEYFQCHGSTCKRMIHPVFLYNSFIGVKAFRLFGLDPFPSYSLDFFKNSFYPSGCYIPTHELSLVRYALSKKYGISFYTIEIQCLSRLEGLEWSASFSRIIFDLILSEGDMARICDLLADQLSEPRNIKFLEEQISLWRDDSKTEHLPFRLIRTLCALSKLGHSSQLASIVHAISIQLSVYLGVLEKSMLLHAGNHELFKELKNAVLYYITQPPHDKFTAEDQAVCFVFESLMYSNPKSGRQVLADVLAYLEEKDVHKTLKRVASGLVK